MLKNPRHEKLAQAYARQLATQSADMVTKSAVYSEVFPRATPAAARSGATRLLTNNNEVQDRARQLVLRFNPIERVSADLQRLRRFKRHVLDKDGKLIAKTPDGQVQLSAVQTCLKIHGVLSDAPQVDARSVSFNITNETASQLTDTLAKIEAVAQRLRADADA
jgi:hypothetical protein